MKKFIENIKRKLLINKLKKYEQDENKSPFIERFIKILNIRRIVQKTGMTYSNGEFYFGGGFAIPDFRTEEEKQRDWEEKTKNWSEYRKKHGYEEGSYMDIINKRFGGIKDIWVDQDFTTGAILGKITYF